MRLEAEPWLRQAEADLQAAQDSLIAAHYEWACFQAQQSGEKALKAFLHENEYGTRAIRAIFHSMRGPGSALEACQQFQPGFSSLDFQAQLLDQYSIATRYPDSLTLMGRMAPADYFDAGEAQSCILAATSILNFVKELVKANRAKLGVV